MRNLKVGDKVKVKSLEWYNSSKDEEGCIYFAAIFIPAMSDLCGKVVTISEKYSSVSNFIYRIKEGDFYWCEEFFEDLNNCDDIRREDPEVF